MAVSSNITVNVRALAVGGAGVGEVVAQADGSDDLLGITAFVPFTGIGEVVSARIVEQKQRYVKAELVSVDSASPERVEPRCPYFISCGGCELQHLSYESQLEAKFDMIKGSLRAAKLESKVLDALKPLVPGAAYGYRQRINLHVDASGRVGFYRQGTRSVIPIESCAVAAGEINRVLKRIQSIGPALQGKISSILLEEDDEGIVAVLKSPYDLGKGEMKEILATAKSCFGNVSVVAAGNEVGGFGRQIIELNLNEKGTLKIKVPAGSFSQINWGVNQALIKRVVKAAQVSYGTKVHDLYAGAGNFSLPLARAGAFVTAVECDPRLVSFGRENTQRHNLGKKISYVEMSVEKFLNQRKSNDTPSLVLADPPRSGLGQLVSLFTFCERMLLVSCHLPSFVRDLKTLLEREWEVESIEPFDMFAQTSYVEILGVLKRL